ncbi:hypothetical protein MMC19_002011 [Ptychographa xylographoides]|nr:hypothetical protein [Ptychographa xylographoides]
MLLQRLSICILILGTLEFTIASYAIKGCQGGVNSTTGQRPFRQEFSSFQASGAAFDLYIQALQQLIQKNQLEQLSFYQVAGIHGYPLKHTATCIQSLTTPSYPNIPWDGVTGAEPYVALYEQLLWENSQSIASTYPTYNRATYQAAAETFRMPYWDWSLNPQMPSLVNSPTITITTPNGSHTITNPLYNYTFNPLPGPPYFPLDDGISQFLSTVRYPSSSSPNATSQSWLVNQQLEANGQALHDLTYQLLASQPHYGPFSNTAFTGKNGTTYNSLENMHNFIHALVGNGGHMSYIPYSSFDPVFWLHHTNVDRITAIWQALYPSSFTVPQPNQYGTYTNQPGEIENADTPLTPFSSNVNGTLYTSNTVRHTKSFGYTYPEVVDWGVNATQLSANVRRTINALYDYSDDVTSRSESGVTLAKRSRRSVSIKTADREWAINVRTDTTRLTTALFIHFYLSLPPPDPAAWSSSPTLVASLPIFLRTLPHVPPSISPHTSASAHPDYTRGTIPLTHALLPRTTDLSPTNVIPFLHHHLQWRARRFDDSVVDAAELVATGAVVVQVVSRVVERSRKARSGGDDFPSYGEWSVGFEKALWVL